MKGRASILRSNYIGAASKVNPAFTLDLGSGSLGYPYIWDLLLTDFRRLTSMPIRGTSSTPMEGGDAVAKKKATKKKKK